MNLEKIKESISTLLEKLRMRTINFLTKVLFFLCFIAIFGCEKHEALPIDYHSKIITINPTKYHANIAIKESASIYTINPFATWYIETYKHFDDGDVCLIGKYAEVFIYEITNKGWEDRYEYTCVITDTIYIDSTKFQPIKY
jgi:hypothetical protein